MSANSPIQNVAEHVSSGPGWTFWAILLSAFIALLSIAAQRAVAKRRAAIDLVLRSESEEFLAHRAAFEDVVRNNHLIQILNPQSGEDYTRKRSVRELLNHYELLAISIFNGIVDEQIVKQYQYTTFTQTWRDAEALIVQLQSQPDTKTAFCNFQRLAESWIADPAIEKGAWPKIKSIFFEIIPW